MSTWHAGLAQTAGEGNHASARVKTLWFKGRRGGLLNERATGHFGTRLSPFARRLILRSAGGPHHITG